MKECSLLFNIFRDFKDKYSFLTYARKLRRKQEKYFDLVYFGCWPFFPSFYPPFCFPACWKTAE